MFKFGFSRDTEAEEKDLDTKTSSVDWIPATKVEVSSTYVENLFEHDDYTENTIFPGCKLKVIRTEKALVDLEKQNCKNIIQAESQHSDLVPAVYEGGLKIWECSYDLGRYIFESNIELRDKLVLDLGCGAGLIGVVALLRNAFVHFQDYNVEVIKTVTIPNILLNSEEREKVLERCEFYCGDWESFATLFDADESKKYDIIFTSETIYNPENHRKLYEVFKQRLNQNGVGFIAGKSYYFGVGGGMKQFQDLILKDNVFDVEVAWKTEGGLQREILKIARKQRLRRN